MQNNPLACFFYPTTVVLIDDSHAFLSNMRLKLANTFATLLYQNPQAALADLINKQQLQFSGSKLFNTYQNDELITEQAWSKIIDINVRNIYQQVYNPKRFLDITTLVVDYSMPDMDGIKFCEKLKDYPVRKLMLTGKASNAVAIKAFNDRIIDKFFVKDTKNTLIEIKEAIKYEQQSYFYNCSKALLEIIAEHGTNPLRNDTFIKIFNSLYERVNACEYYLLDLSGSFLLLDMDAKPTILLVKSSIEIENYFQIAKDSDAPIDILRHLKSREKIPFLFTEEDNNLSPIEWRQHLYPARPLDSNGLYYYSIIDGQIEGLETSKILPYRSFLKNIIS